MLSNATIRLKKVREIQRKIIMNFSSKNVLVSLYIYIYVWSFWGKKLGGQNLYFIYQIFD